jgi:hypothetical protein
LLLFLEALTEADSQILNEGTVRSVEPDDRPVRAVVVIVPGKAGSGYEISGFHGKRFAVDRGLRASATDDEADGAHRVMMRLGDFSGLYELGTEKHGMNGAHLHRRCAKPDEPSKRLRQVERSLLFTWQRVVNFDSNRGTNA